MSKFADVKEVLIEALFSSCKTTEVAAADAKHALLVRGRKSKIAAEKKL